MTEKTIIEIAAELPPFPDFDKMLSGLTPDGLVEIIGAARDYAEVCGSMTISQFRATMADDDDALVGLLMAIHLAKRHAN